MESMKCPECDEGVVDFSEKTRKVVCPVCNYQDSLGGMISQRLSLGGADVLRSSDSRYNIYHAESGEFMAKMILVSASQKRVRILLEADQPSLIVSEIVLLGDLFGEVLDLKVTQTGADMSFFCPVCGGVSFKRLGPERLMCGSHYEVDIQKYAESLVLAYRFKAVGISPGSFGVSFENIRPGGLLKSQKIESYLVAKVEIRPRPEKTVIAVRPVASALPETVYEEVLAKVMEALDMKVEGVSVVKIKK